LAAELQEQFSLRHVLVIDVTDADYYLLLRELSRATMALLSKIVTENDVLGLASARVLLGMGETIATFVPCPVVQLTGAISPPDASDIIHTVRSVAQVGGGTPYSFYAPLIAADESAKQTYLRQPDVRRASAMLPRVTVAVIGIGRWAPGLSTAFDGVDEPTQKEATDDGVLVEAGGILLDGVGKPVRTRLAQRMVAPTFEQLRRAQTIIGAAFNAERAEAVRIAIQGGLIDALVTHRSLAQRLLSLPARRL
jgi:DNA-binding transcriptional regulator LsrR (DeoR family)